MSCLLFPLMFAILASSLHLKSCCTCFFVTQTAALIYPPAQMNAKRGALVRNNGLVTLYYNVYQFMKQFCVIYYVIMKCLSS